MEFYMGRRRVLKQFAMYEVSSCVVREIKDLSPESIKKMFLDVINRAKKKYKFSIINFVVMNNFFNFILEPLEDESLSRIMQWIKSVFAMKYNKMHNYSGAFWKCRFKSKIIDDIKQAFNQVSNIPVKLGIVNESKDFKFGGLYFILRKIFDIVDEPEFDFQK
jgi:REP element-mobilizing transposase RayT